jgi:hypothetical protein
VTSDKLLQMGWLLGHQPVREPELIDAYLLAVGKSLCLASYFEKKCQWVLRVAKLAEHYETDTDLDSFWMFAQAFRDKLLGPTLMKLSGLGDSEADIKSLEEGRVARNFIAHEAAVLGYLPAVREEDLIVAIQKLRQQLPRLIAADNLISKWVYEIEEREPAPESIQAGYAERVTRWVFGSLVDE